MDIHHMRNIHQSLYQKNIEGYIAFNLWIIGKSVTDLVHNVGCFVCPYHLSCWQWRTVVIFAMLSLCGSEGEDGGVSQQIQRIMAQSLWWSRCRPEAFGPIVACHKQPCLLIAAFPRAWLGTRSYVTSSGKLECFSVKLVLVNKKNPNNCKSP